MHHAETSPGLF